MINEDYESSTNQTNCHNCKKKLKDKPTNNKMYRKVTVIVIVLGNTEVLHIAYVI